LIRNTADLSVFVVRRLASIYEKLFGLIIHNFVLANEEPRGAWRTLSDSGFFGGNTFVSALRADPISASDSDFQFWRCLLDKVRMFFGEISSRFEFSKVKSGLFLEYFNNFASIVL